MWQDAGCHRRLEVFMNVRTFLAIATQRSTVLRAMKIAIVVGIILVAVNEGGALIRREIDLAGLISAAMNFAVPYCVSTVSTVLAHAETRTDETETNDF